MKRVILLLVIVFAFTAKESNSQIKIDDTPYIQIGTEDYRVISMGIETNIPNNRGKYAMEYWVEQEGFNFWKPWPTPNSGNYILFLRDDHNIGIGSKGDSNYKLRVEGSIWCTSITTSSDEKLKKNIKPLENSLNKILALKGFSYDYNIEKDKYKNMDLSKVSKDKLKTIENDKKIKYNKKSMGFLAQDLEKVLPNAVSLDDEGMYSIDYQAITPLLVEAIKEQQQQIERLEKLLQQTSNSGVSEKNTAILYQVFASSAGEITEIDYYLPKSVKQASIVIYNVDGENVKTIPIDIHESKASINPWELSAGIYIYTLLADGQEVDLKQMVLTK